MHLFFVALMDVVRESVVRVVLPSWFQQLRGPAWCLRLAGSAFELVLSTPDQQQDLVSFLKGTSLYEKVLNNRDQSACGRSHSSPFFEGVPIQRKTVSKLISFSRFLEHNGLRMYELLLALG